jgi:hypothetical protein
VGTLEGTLGGTLEGTLGGTLEDTLEGTLEGTLGGTLEGTLGGTLEGTESLSTLTCDLSESNTDSVSPALILSSKCFSAPSIITSTEYPMSSNSLSNV